MLRVIHATYDGKTLLPEEPIDLKPFTRVRVTIEYNEAKKKNSCVFYAPPNP